MVLPDGYEARAPRPDDVAAVAGVLLAGGGQTVLDEDFVRHEWGHEGFDLTTDAWVVTDRSGTVVAYAQVKRGEPGVIESWGAVGPEHRGRGIGSWLLDRIEERAAVMATAPGRFRHAIDRGDDAAAALLSARGLRPLRHFWHMEIDLGAHGPPGPSPEGIEIRAVATDEDIVSVHRVLDVAFAGDWDYHPEPFDRWLADAAASPDHDPSLWLLATDGRAAVGALTASAWRERGWVSELGVLPEHRGRGIGGALLRRSFADLGRRGLPTAVLNVDAENPTGATAVYEAVGMRVVNGWDLWEREPGGR